MRLWLGCSSGKYGYTSEREAQQALFSVQRFRRNERGRGRKPGHTETGTYLCKACRSWHLTSRSKRNRQRSR